ncbi:uncharacterized protein LOC143305646 [Osmia lignaria lignaria]|uniref:uncharacterized protein LOC143305646 n=1 Tax=Osmia lignaria lignaria TaxID=1437193 RepID=UPI00402BDF97
MNKRKASADRNSKQRGSSRRPSASSLHSRPNTAHQKLKPEKSPSTQNLVTPEPQNLSKTIQVSKAVETCVPKTRFSSQDRCRELRSYSSPRLKYFPAERIKRFESPPGTPIGALIAQQNLHESGSYYAAGHPEYNNGQGDATTASQSLHQHRPPQHVQSVGQQQVAGNQVAQMNPHSDPTLPQQILSQSHRPFVPHGPRDHSPQKTIANVHNSHSAYHNPSCAMTTPQPVASMMEQERNTSEEPTITHPPDYERQPIGGRNAANYRQAINKQQIQLQSQMSMDPNASNLTPSDHQQLQNHYSRHGQFSQNPQQVYQQMQQNMQQQMQMQQRAMTYQMQAMGGQGQGPYAVQYGRYFPGQGMTTPQDATVNQMKNLRTGQSYGNQGHQRDLDYSMNHQNGWAKGNQVGEFSSIKAQLNPYTVEVTNNNQPHHGTHPYHHAVHQHRPLYKNPGQGTPMMYHQPGFDQQIPANQQMPQQPPTENNQVPKNDNKKSPPFTHSMLRDQEKLLNTMKQQGVPLDIMRRQFDILLNEQKKHLEYLECLWRQDEEEVRRLPVINRKKRNIDEKPEWMTHLTPTRMSYLEMERLREQQKKEQEARLQQQNANEMVNQQPPLQLQNQQISQLQSQQIHQIQNQQAPPQLQNQQIPQLQNQQAPPQLQNQQPYQLWQPNWQQSRISQPYNHMYPQPYMNQGPMNYRHQQSMPDYRYAHQQYNHQHQQQHYQYVPQQNQEEIQQTNGYSGYQDVRQPTEPSSLMKIRHYKNHVRTQKRNNGLQDPEVARRQLEELRANSELRKGLEYLANFAPKKATFRLNGIQDRNETDTEIQNRLPVLNAEPAVKRVSANGLENSRIANNPPPQRLSPLNKLEHEFAKEYPRQREPTPRNCYSVPAERENGTMASEQQPQYLPQQLPVENSANLISYDKNPTMARGNVIMPYKFDVNYPQHYQQMQQYYQNTKNLTGNNGEGDVGVSQKIEMNRKNFERAGGDAYENMNGQVMQEGKIPMQGMQQYGQPDMHEARTIGGVRYLARKQDYLPNQQIVSPETLIASRHLQPPIIY